MHHDDYLVKPLQIPDLLEKLQLLLDLEWILEAPGVTPAETVASSG
jgi:DNA-binding response OmpR family regulator